MPLCFLNPLQRAPRKLGGVIAAATASSYLAEIALPKSGHGGRYCFPYYRSYFLDWKKYPAEVQRNSIYSIACVYYFDNKKAALQQSTPAWLSTVRRQSTGIASGS